MGTVLDMKAQSKVLNIVTEISDLFMVVCRVIFFMKKVFMVIEKILFRMEGFNFPLRRGLAIIGFTQCCH